MANYEKVGNYDAVSNRTKGMPNAPKSWESGRLTLQCKYTWPNRIIYLIYKSTWLKKNIPVLIDGYLMAIWSRIKYCIKPASGTSITSN